MAPTQTIHVVAPPTILTCGIGLEVCQVQREMNRKKLEITMTRYKLQSFVRGFQSV